MLRQSAKFARDIYRYLRFPFGHFRGVYDSFSQAHTATPRHCRIGYDHADVARLYATELDSILENSEYPLVFYLSRALEENCTVLDFGGNVGVHFLRINRVFDLAKFSWIVCDLPQITKVGREICAAYKNIDFIDGMNALSGRPIDIFLACDSLQYASDGGAVFPRLIEQGQRPKHVLIDMLPLYDGPSFVTLQNGGPVCYPTHIFNRQDFLRSIVDLGYELIYAWRCSNFSCNVPFHPERIVRDYSGLYFKYTAEVD
jgi:putative methyltransferase (TIGR04325 family)